MRALINCFEHPVEFMLPKEIEWMVLIDSAKVPAEYIHPQAGNVWLEGFTVQILRATGVKV